MTNPKVSNLAQTVPFSQNQNAATLTEGSKVTGRVIARNPDGTFLISFAGQKLSVPSRVPLVPGQNFEARVRLLDGKLALAVEGAKTEPSSLVSKIAADSKGNLSQPAAAFLQSMGLPADSQSFRLVQFFQQMGMKIDPQQAKKALAVAKKTGKSASDSAQISLLLEDKKILSDENAVVSVMYDGKGQNNQKDEKTDDSDEELSKKTPETPFQVMENYLSSVDEAAEKNKIGVLTAFNALRNLKNNPFNTRHWFILPFEWPKFHAIGDIRLFADISESDLRKVVIRCKKGVKILIFDIYLINNKVESVRFSQNTEAGAFARNAMQKMLKELLEKNQCAEALKKVEYVEYGLLDGFCADQETVSQVRGLV